MSQSIDKLLYLGIGVLLFAIGMVSFYGQETKVNQLEQKLNQAVAAGDHAWIVERKQSQNNGNDQVKISGQQVKAMIAGQLLRSQEIGFGGQVSKHSRLADYMANSLDKYICIDGVVLGADNFESVYDSIPVSAQFRLDYQPDRLIFNTD